MNFDLLCLGEPLIEFNQQASGLYLQGYGGDTSNCAIAAARQGAKTGYISRVGDDSFGRSLKKLWSVEGVDTSCVTTDNQAATGIYFVTHDDDGHHFDYRRAGSAASKMDAQDLPIQALRDTKILHVSGISQAISPQATDAVFAAMTMVKAGGGKVSFDPNLRLALWPLDRARAIIHAGMTLCDIALPGLDDAQLLTGVNDPDGIVEFYLNLGAEIVALTLGTKGALIATRTERRLIPGRKVKAVDATGAGDTFDGAFLARLAAGDDPFTAADYANAAAALSTVGFGAVEPIPSRKSVETFLCDQGISNP